MRTDHLGKIIYDAIPSGEPARHRRRPDPATANHGASRPSPTELIHTPPTIAANDLLTTSVAHELTSACQQRNRVLACAACRRAAEQAKTTRVLQPELRGCSSCSASWRACSKPSAPWIVAGGTNLFIRIPGARSTRDIDLNTPGVRNHTDPDSIRPTFEPLTGENF